MFSPSWFRATEAFVGTRYSLTFYTTKYVNDVDDTILTRLTELGFALPAAYVPGGPGVSGTAEYCGDAMNASAFNCTLAEPQILSACADSSGHINDVDAGSISRCGEKLIADCYVPQAATPEPVRKSSRILTLTRALVPDLDLGPHGDLTVGSLFAGMDVPLFALQCMGCVTRPCLSLKKMKRLSGSWLETIQRPGSSQTSRAAAGTPCHRSTC